MRRKTNPRRTWGAPSSAIDYDTHTQQDWGRWDRKGHGGSPPKTPVEGSDGSDSCESSSTPDSESDEESVEEMALPLEEHAWEAYEEHEVQEYKEFPKLFRERKFCILSVSYHPNASFEVCSPSSSPKNATTTVSLTSKNFLPKSETKSTNTSSLTTVRSSFGRIGIKRLGTHTGLRGFQARLCYSKITGGR